MPVVIIPVIPVTITIIVPAGPTAIIIIPIAALTPIIPAVAFIITVSITIINITFALSKRIDKLDEGVRYFYYD